MKIKMVCLEDGYVSFGFRKMVSFIESLNEDTTAYYVSTNLNFSIRSIVMASYGGRASDKYLDAIAQELVDADILGFSSMTGYADLTKRLIDCVREKSKKPFIIWGGVHPIICPEDAINADVDAICTGEGEAAFKEFYEKYSNGIDFTNTRNFWFKKNGFVIKNGFRPLASPAEMELLPFPKYAGREFVFKERKGFVQSGIGDYLNSSGLSYLTLWSIGCPFSCAYCANSKFISNDPKYRNIRHTSPRYIIDEVKRAKIIHPYISFVSFQDDSFMSIKLDDLKEFSELWRNEVRLPFAVYGVIPNYVREDKLEVLTWAGMNRVRMGIQSGSQRILDFYRRPTRVSKIEEAAQTLHKYEKYHIAPCFDLILDNPIETREDIVDTLELIYRLPRPYFLFLFSLRIIPQTELEGLFKERGIDTDKIDKYYGVISPNLSNILFYMLTLYKPPRKLFVRLLQNVRAHNEEQSFYPKTALLFRIMYLLKRGFVHLRHMDFSVITGWSGYVFWRFGIVGFWRKYIIPRKNALNITENKDHSQIASQ